MSKLQLIWLLALGTVNTGLAFDESKGQEDTSGALYIEMGDPEDHSESDSSSGSAGWRNKLYNWSALAWHYTLSREAPYYEKIRHFLLTHPKIQSTCDGIGQTAIASGVYSYFISLLKERDTGVEFNERTEGVVRDLFDVTTFVSDNASKGCNRQWEKYMPKLTRAHRVAILGAIYIPTHLAEDHFAIIGLTHLVWLMFFREIMDGWTELSREETVHGETIGDLEAQIAAEIAPRNSEFEEDDQC